MEINRKKRLGQLDALRFFALFVIVVSHFEFLKETSFGVFYDKYFCNPIWGVDYFFLLSGFGLFYANSSENIDCKIHSSIKFAISKIRKIYPLYIISLILSLPFNFLYYGLNIKTVIAKFIINLTLLQSCFGSIRFSHGINDVCWFLSSLFICYIFAPLMINVIRKYISSLKKSIIAVCCTFILILGLSFLAIMIERNVKIFQYNFFDDLFYGSPYIRIFYVFLGCLCANLYSQIEIRRNTLSYIEFLFVALLIAYFFLRNSIKIDTIIIRFIDVSFVFLTLLLFSFGKGFISKNLENCSFLKKLGGDYGMYIYLLHYPVRMTVRLLFQDKIIKGLDYMYLIMVLIILLVTLFLSYLCKELLNRSIDMRKQS